MLEPLISRINKRYRIVYERAIRELIAVLGAKASELFQASLDKYSNMQTSWKKLMAVMGLTTVSAYLIKTFNLESLVKSTVKEQLQSFFEKYIGGNFIGTILSKTTDIKTYLGFLGSAVGGVQFVADSLETASGAFARDSAGPV